MNVQAVELLPNRPKGPTGRTQAYIIGESRGKVIEFNPRMRKPAYLGNGRSEVYEPVSEMYASCKCQMRSNTLGGSAVLTSELTGTR